MISKFLFFLFKLIYIPLGIFTLLGLLAPHIPISWIPPLQLLPIFIPYFIPIHILAILVIPWRTWKLKSFAVLCLGICVWIGLYEFRIRISPDPQEANLRVVSFNVRSFNYQPERHEDSLISLLSGKNPDIICFQEFNNKDNKKGVEFLAVLSDRLQLPYRAFHQVSGTVGGAILSKYPILENEKLYNSNGGANIGMWAIVETPIQRLGIYNFHLASYRFDTRQEKASLKGGKNKLKSLLLLIWRRASIVIPEQERMADIIYAHASQHDGNIIISGDMNSVPYTRIPGKFRKRFQDSFLSAGHGYGMTFPLFRFLGMRIDYQFSSPSLKIVRHHVLKSKISDHYPIMVDYQFSP